MDPTHLHLILNHVPVFGLISGFLILAWGALREYEEVQKIGLAVLLISAFVAVPVYLTGEPAEEVVENLPGVSEQIIELHEDSALLSLILAIITGVLALFALATKRLPNAKVGSLTVYVTLVLSLTALVAIAYTANLGGQIRHTEIRQSNSAARPPETTKSSKNDDDDH